MRVADLKRLLEALPAFLESAGASVKAVGDARKAAEVLAPFQALDLDAFASFLARAEEYDRTGIVPTVAAPKKPARAKAPAKPKMTIADGLALAQACYEKAIPGGPDDALIEGELKALDQLTAGDLNKVAEQFGERKGKTKKDTLSYITSKILKRRDLALRNNFVSSL
jgi:hypothetical protein